MSGFGLKMIAVITMLIDHTAATILERALMQMLAGGPIIEQNYNVFLGIYFVMRIIGRMAFPIYCFLLVEGFHYTKSRAKYALRLFLFALISEIPFDMAFNQKIWDFSYNNVFLTLLLGLLTIMAADWVKERFAEKKALKVILMILCMLAGAALAQFVLITDYGAFGVIAIFIMYLMYQRRMAGFALMIVPLAVSSLMEAAAFLMLIPLHFYNGTRGKQCKYFFYIFYPAHLLILSLICWALGLGI